MSEVLVCQFGFSSKNVLCIKKMLKNLLEQRILVFQRLFQVLYRILIKV